MILKNKIPVLVLALSCISFSTALNASTICRNALFLAFLFSFIDFYNVKAVARKDKFFYFLVTMAIFSGVMVIHNFIFPSTILANVDESYLYTSLRILMAVFILYYLSQQGERLSERSFLFAKLMILFGFFVFSLQGFYFHNLSPDERLSIKTIPTTVAYVYSIQSFASIYIIAKWKNKARYFVLPVVICFSFYIILLTGTRSAIISYPFIIAFFVMNRGLINKRIFIFYAFIVLGMAIIINHQSFHNSIDRVMSTANEVNDYRNNNGNTSLGARFSLWKAGFYAFKLNPLGQSADQRYIEAKNYIDSHEHQNPEALRVLHDHLHNDLIETTTLRGCGGMLALLLFYFSLGYMLASYSENKDGLTLLLAPLIIYGLTDVFFIDLRNVTTLMTALPLYLLFNRSHQSQSKT